MTSTWASFSFWVYFAWSDILCGCSRAIYEIVSQLLKKRVSS